MLKTCVCSWGIQKSTHTLELFWSRGQRHQRKGSHHRDIIAQTGKTQTYSDIIEALISRSVLLSPEMLGHVEACVSWVEDFVFTPACIGVKSTLLIVDDYKQKKAKTWLLLLSNHTAATTKIGVFTKSFVKFALLDVIAEKWGCANNMTFNPPRPEKGTFKETLKREVDKQITKKQAQPFPFLLHYQHLLGN